jgi:hypothetical protein
MMVSALPILFTVTFTEGELLEVAAGLQLRKKRLEELIRQRGPEFDEHWRNCLDRAEAALGKI